MNTFFLKHRSGLVVINADSPEEALELLRKYEGSSDDQYLSHSATPDDFKEVGEEKGVVSYMAI